MNPATRLNDIVARARACTVCAAHLPFPPRPILRASPTARLLIIGQAPGLKVQQTGIPWNDPSGDRLRGWLGLDRETFYDETRIAIVPTGLCYPGRDPRGGDLPPRPECAPLWHPPLLKAMPAIELILLIGAHAQRHHLGDRTKTSVAVTVAAWREYLPRYLPLPHPSPRNRRWLALHPWVESELIPDVRSRVAKLMRCPTPGISADAVFVDH